jgi:hypothetical protein
MEEKCFCETDKYGYPSLSDRLFCCVCKGQKEELIKLRCCGKYVHRSCFINSTIIYTNNIINSKDIQYTTTLSDIQLCLYCRKEYDKEQFPNLPYTNEESILRKKYFIIRDSMRLLLIILTIFSCVLALSDNILLARRFIDNCERNNTNNCSELFYDKTKWKMVVVLITSILGFGSCMAFMLSDIGLFYYKLFKNGDDIFKNINVDDIINQYKNKINQSKEFIKILLNYLIPLLLVLIWQLGYLTIMIGYNQWYIPLHTTSNITVEEAHKLVLDYIPILCLFNIFWLTPLGFIIFSLIYILIYILYIIGYNLCKIISKCYCYRLCVDRRNKIKDKLATGKTNIQLYSIDIDESIKKSNIV